MIWYAVLCLVKWESVTGSVGAYEARLKQPSDAGIGFLPVFSTREAAEEWADGAPVQAIRASDVDHE